MLKEEFVFSLKQTFATSCSVWVIVGHFPYWSCTQHSIVFGGPSSTSLRERINDAKSKVLVTMDGFYRRGKTINTKAIVDETLELTSSIQNVIVLKRTGQEINMVEERDIWWHTSQYGVRPEYETSGKNPLFVLYTSGTTAKPRVLHTFTEVITSEPISPPSGFWISRMTIYSGAPPVLAGSPVTAT